MIFQPVKKEPISVHASLTDVDELKGAIVKSIDGLLIAKIDRMVCGSVVMRHALQMAGDPLPAPKYMLFAPEQTVILNKHCIPHNKIAP